MVPGSAVWCSGAVQSLAALIIYITGNATQQHCDSGSDDRWESVPAARYATVAASADVNCIPQLRKTAGIATSTTPSPPGSNGIHDATVPAVAASNATSIVSWEPVARHMALRASPSTITAKTESAAGVIAPKP